MSVRDTEPSDVISVIVLLLVCRRRHRGELWIECGWSFASEKGSGPGGDPSVRHHRQSLQQQELDATERSEVTAKPHGARPKQRPDPTGGQDLP